MGDKKKMHGIKREPIKPDIKRIMDEDPNRMKVYFIKMEREGTLIECSIKTDWDSAVLAKESSTSFDGEILTTLVFARNEEQAVKIANKRLKRANEKGTEKWMKKTKKKTNLTM